MAYDGIHYEFILIRMIKRPYLLMVKTFSFSNENVFSRKRSGEIEVNVVQPLAEEDKEPLI